MCRGYMRLENEAEAMQADLGDVAGLSPISGHGYGRISGFQKERVH